MIDSTYDVSFSGSKIRVRNRPGLTPLMPLVPLATLGKATKEGRFWSIPLPDAPAVITWARQNQLSVDPQVVAYADDLWVRELRFMGLSNATELPADTDPVKVRGLTSTLLPTQQVAVQLSATCWMDTPGAKNNATHRSLIVADEPGLGKTICALSAVRVEGLERSRVLIVCPTSLTENWSKEMDQHFVEGTFHPWIAQTKNPSPPPEDVDTVIIGWQILSDWEAELAKWSPDAIVLDEGHYAKSGRERKVTKDVAVKNEDGTLKRDENGNAFMVKETKKVSGSARATAALNLSTIVEKNHGLVVTLTGTPIVNRPIELEPLLDLTGLLPLWGTQRAYQMRHCGPKQVSIGKGRTTWQFQGASHLLELNTRLRTSGHYVRRTKQVLIDSGLMQKKYVDKVFTFDYETRPRPWLIRATDEEMAEYRACEDDNADFFRERAMELAQSMNTRVDSMTVRRKLEAEGAGSKHLTRITELRQQAAKVKVPYVIEQAQRLIDRGEKLVIAAHYREIVDAYADAFTGLKIQGALGVKAIEEAKALFNETPVTEHPVLVLSVEAGKTGHTLCKQALHGVGPACAYMIFAEQIWTPGDEAQAQDRIWRIGQDREVHISNAVLAGSIDEQMYWQRFSKRRVVNAAIDAIGDPSERDDSNEEKKGRGQLVGMLAYRNKNRPVLF